MEELAHLFCVWTIFSDQLPEALAVTAVAQVSEFMDDDVSDSWGRGKTEGEVEG